MSRPSTATAPRNPIPLSTRSAWSKGPPQTATAPSRSQSPAPSTPAQQTHSRRPSQLQGVHVKDGVTVPRNNVGVVKQGLSSKTFGRDLQSLTFYIRFSGNFWINRRRFSVNILVTRRRPVYQI